MKRANPEKNCFLEYDKLYVDHKIFVYNEALGQVVEQAESLRYGGNEIYSRPGTQMMMIGSGMMNGPPFGGMQEDQRFFSGPSRPPSGLSTHGGR